MSGMWISSHWTPRRWRCSCNGQATTGGVVWGADRRRRNPGDIEIVGPPRTTIALLASPQSDYPSAARSSDCSSTPIWMPGHIVLHDVVRQGHMCRHMHRHVKETSVVDDGAVPFSMLIQWAFRYALTRPRKTARQHNSPRTLIWAPPAPTCPEMSAHSTGALFAIWLLLLLPRRI